VRLAWRLPAGSRRAVCTQHAVHFPHGRAVLCCRHSASAALGPCADPGARTGSASLVALIVIDGMREIHDYRLLRDQTHPWQVPPSAHAFDIHRDGYRTRASQALGGNSEESPARVPAAATAEPNASGWVADAYHLADYDPTPSDRCGTLSKVPPGRRCSLTLGMDTRFSCAHGRM